MRLIAIMRPQFAVLLRYHIAIMRPQFAVLLRYHIAILRLSKDEQHDKLTITTNPFHSNP